MAYKFNNINAATTFGIEFLPGTTSELLKLPKRKEGLTINWADENGTERYLGETHYESMVYNLPIVLMADSEAQFWTRYNAFANFLINSGLFTFDVEHLNRRFRLSYSDLTGVQNLTPIKGTGKKGCFMTLVLFNDYPTERLDIP